MDNVTFGYPSNSRSIPTFCPTHGNFTIKTNTQIQKKEKVY